MMRGRFAPSPTGYIHLGNVWTAFLCWLYLRQHQGTVVLRIEDIDEQRSKPAFTEALLEDLTWLGLMWDEGPYDQQDRYALYDAALETLRASGRLYPCYCSRARLQAIGAPHEGEHVVYDGHCYGLTEAQRQSMTKTPSWRVHVPAKTISFTDGLYGPQQMYLPTGCGDFVVRRADGLYAYQLAVSVDDGRMGITHVIRGRDLLSSTAQQRWLMSFLGYDVPEYIHVPMLLDPAGHRLSKRQHGITVRDLRRQEGVTNEQILSYVAYLARLVPERRLYTLAELVASCQWERLTREDVCIHEDIGQVLKEIQ